VTDKNCLSYWFPRIQAAGLPVPRTEIIRLTVEEGLSLKLMLDGGSPPCLNRLVEEIALATSVVGLPAFLRTGHVSAKHEWERTCFLASSGRRDIANHVAAIVEYSELADPFGLAGLSCDAWVVREMLKVKTLFHAFGGNMPIVREFRVFVEGGVVTWIQPYWIPDSLCGRVKEDLSWHRDDDWDRALDVNRALDVKLPGRLSLLEEVSSLNYIERALLTAWSLKAALACEDDFSVDWLQTTDRGWVLTDMALAKDSFRWGERSL
jgi:hypothetical protein